MSGIIAAIAVGVAVAGLGLSAYGMSEQAAAAKDAANYQAAVGRNNAILAQRAADDAMARGKIAEQNTAAAGRQLLGRERATLAGNGVDVNSGSALDITTDTAGANKLDQLTVLSNAQREADSYTAQGANFSAQAALSSASANGGANGMLGTAFAGAGNVAQKWYDYSKISGTTTSGGVTTGYDPTTFNYNAGGNADLMSS